MADKTFLVPEFGFVNIPDAGSREYLIPEFGFINEGAAGGGGDPDPPGPPAEGAGMFFCNG